MVELDALDADDCDQIEEDIDCDPDFPEYGNYRAREIEFREKQIENRRRLTRFAEILTSSRPRLSKVRHLKIRVVQGAIKEAIEMLELVQENVVALENVFLKEVAFDRYDRNTELSNVMDTFHEYLRWLGDFPRLQSIKSEASNRRQVEGLIRLSPSLRKLELDCCMGSDADRDDDVCDNCGLTPADETLGMYWRDYDWGGQADDSDSEDSGGSDTDDFGPPVCSCFDVRFRPLIHKIQVRGVKYGMVSYVALLVARAIGLVSLEVDSVFANTRITIPFRSANVLRKKKNLRHFVWTNSHKYQKETPEVSNGSNLLDVGFSDLVKHQ